MAKRSPLLNVLTTNPHRDRALEVHARAAHFAALALVFAGCGTRGGEPGALRALFSDELPELEVATEPADGSETSDERRTTPKPSPTNPTPKPARPDPTPSAPTTSASTTSPAPTTNPTTSTSDGPDNSTDVTQTSDTSTTQPRCPVIAGDLTLGQSCVVGVGRCASVGQVECVDLELTCSAVANAPMPEECNGEDDDCNGSVDDDIAPSGSCTAGTGVCEQPGQYTCQSGRLVCDAAPGSQSAEVCNGEDDDCDGLTDEGFGFERCTAGLGVCARSGYLVCQQGELDCDAVPGTATVELCDGKDDDCDGAVDEDFDLGAACTAGRGICERAGEIVCASNGTARCSATPGQAFGELCNDEDDDCDGAVDNGYVCPDATVANTKPFTSGVWYTGTTSSCGVAYVLQFYPTLNETNYFSSFPCYVNWWYFRPSDGALLYDVTFDNTIERHTQGQPRTILLTAPVGIRPPFGTDALDRIYYLGQDRALRRDYNEILATAVGTLSAVAADGRTLITRGDQPIILSADGATETPFDPLKGFSGTSQLRLGNVTVDGNDLFVLYTRDLPSGQRDVGILRIYPDNEVRLVRRFLLDSGAQLGSATPLSDGNILELTQDPDAPGELLIRRYAPDGTTTVLWREVNATFGIHGGAQLLVGPRL